jgi:hypothetical protein
VVPCKCVCDTIIRPIAGSTHHARSACEYVCACACACQTHDVRVARAHVLCACPLQRAWRAEHVRVRTHGVSLFDGWCVMHSLRL